MCLQLDTMFDQKKIQISTHIFDAFLCGEVLSSLFSMFRTDKTLYLVFGVLLDTKSSVNLRKIRRLC